MDKKRVVFSVILLIIMIGSTIIFSFAYFTTIFEDTYSSRYEVTSAILPTVLIESSTDVSLDITSDMMSEENINSKTPVTTKETTTPIKLKIITSETGGTTDIYYNIYYNPTTVYTSSAENIMNEKELVLSIESSINGLIVDEYNLGNINSNTLLYSGMITVSGVNVTKIEEFTITAGYYNQEFDQTDNAGLNFYGSVNLELGDITYY